MKNKYKRNFLTKVILRIDFERAKPGQFESVAKMIKKEFPFEKEEKGEEGMINFDFSTKAISQMSEPVTSWSFFDKKRIKRIKIHPRFLFAEYLSYKNSTELLKDSNLIAEIIKKFEIKTINRLGLRYINEIKLEDRELLKWDNYINKSLVGFLDFAIKNKKNIARAMGKIVFKYNDSDINFKFGIWNSDFPNEINEKIFILDFDNFSKFPLNVETLNLCNIVKDYNQRIENLFESSIKNGLRKILET